MSEEISIILFTKLFILSGKVSMFEDKNARRMGRMKQSTILAVTLPNVHQF